MSRLRRKPAPATSTLEESAELHDALRAGGLDLVPLVAPTSDDARIERMARQASGFIYCVAVVGITGARTSMSGDVAALVQRVRRYSDLPVAIGFGISTAEHVRQVALAADGAAIGSALVDVIAHAAPGEEAARAAAYWQGLR